MIHSVYLLLFQCALNLFHVSSLIANPIVGGNEDGNHVFNHQVSIHVLTEDTDTDTYHFICSGTIVSQSHILTAAHCFMNKVNGEITIIYRPGNRRIKIIAGTNKIDGQGTQKEVERIFIPHHFRQAEKHHGDIAVAVLESDLGVEPGSHIMQILPMGEPFRNNDLDNREVACAGYGQYQLQMDNHGQWVPTGGYSRIIRYIDLVILPRSKCSVYNSAICARSMDEVNLHVVCNGDSGAGLIFNGHVVGVLSTGPTDCNSNELSTYFTRISYFRDFVNRAMIKRAYHHDMHILKDDDRPTHTGSSSRQHRRRPSF